MKLRLPLLALALTGLSLCACGKTNRIVAPATDDPLSNRSHDRDAEVFGASWSGYLLPNEDLPRSDPANSDPWHTWPFGRIRHWDMIDEVQTFDTPYDDEFIHASISPPHGVFGKQIDRFGFTDLGFVGNIEVDRIRVQTRMVAELRGSLYLQMKLRYLIAGVAKDSLTYWLSSSPTDTLTWTAEFGAPGYSAADIANLQVEVEAFNPYPASIRIDWMHASVHSYPKQKPPPIPTEG
jgi:hypothetical protein